MVDPDTRQFKISKKADKFIKSLPDDIRKEVKEAVSNLITGGFQNLDIKRLPPYPHEYRLRVGKIRLLFKSERGLLFIFKAGFRGDVYKK